MSRTVSRRLLARSPLSIGSKESTTCSHQFASSNQPFSSSSHSCAENDSRRPEYVPFPRFRAGPAKPTMTTSPSLNPKAAIGGSGGTAGLLNIFKDLSAQRSEAKQRITHLDPTSVSSDGTFDGGLPRLAGPQKVESWQLHIYAHRHNVHITVVRPPNWQNPETGVRYGVSGERTVALSMSAGQLGFKHGGRKHYDSAFQLASFVFARMQDSGMSSWIPELEVSLRGFGAGREAVSKALMGTEGRALRGKVIKVSDATKLKFGGTRSPKPRRLG